MKNIENILSERELTHGKFSTVADNYCEIKTALSCGDFSNIEHAAIDMIAMKLARIAAGNASEIDHWRDIAGYAQLVIKDLEKHQK